MPVSVTRGKGYRPSAATCGDFDTDGTTATAVLFTTLARKLPTARRYNPWYSEGYGLQVKQVERFAAKHADARPVDLPGVGAPPAIANAVVDALWHLGVRHIDIPITPQKV